MSLFKDHADVFLARVATGASPTLTVYDGKVPDPTPNPSSNPYVVVRFVFYTQTAEQAPSIVALNNDAWPLQTDAYTYSVGGSEAASRAVASQVYSRLVGYTPTLSGRTCFSIRHVDSAPRDPDETTGVAVGTTAHIYRLVTDPN